MAKYPGGLSTTVPRVRVLRTVQVSYQGRHPSTPAPASPTFVPNHLACERTFNSRACGFYLGSISLPPSRSLQLPRLRVLPSPSHHLLQPFPSTPAPAGHTSQGMRRYFINSFNSRDCGSYSTRRAPLGHGTLQLPRLRVIPSAKERR